MSYRINKKPIKPENRLKRFYVRNGATLDVAFPCYYFKPIFGHDPHYHDYVGWPSPNHVGRACQMHPPRDRFRWLAHPVMRRNGDLIPIHFIEEGYTEASITFEDPDVAEHIDARAWVDIDDDYIVRMYINTDFETFKDRPIDTRFSVFIKKNQDDIVRKDVVCHGILSILPGSPYEIE